MITVANIRTTKQGEYIGRAMPRQGLRGSPLGNPYRLAPGVARWVPIRQYHDWLRDKLATDTPQRREIDRLVALARQGDLTLLCWCAPQSCHGDVVAEFIRAELAKEAL